MIRRSYNYNYEKLEEENINKLIILLQQNKNLEEDIINILNKYNYINTTIDFLKNNKNLLNFSKSHEIEPVS